MRAQPIRFTGMASGMDTDSIVKDLLRPQQYKIDNQKKAQALVKLKQDAWKDMNKKLFDFHRNFTEKLGRGSTFNKNITTSSNDNAMSITNSETVPEGTHTFDVTKLAESAMVVAKGADGVDLSKNDTIGDLMGEGVATPKKLTMRVNGEIVEVDVKSTDKLSDIAKSMNDKLKGKGFTASYDEANGSFFVRSTATGKNQNIDFDPMIKIDPKTGPEFVRDPQSIELFKKIGLVKVEKVKVEEVVDGETVEKEVDKIVESRFAGKEAIYSYNGAEFTSPTNKIEVNGIKATLKAAGTGPITISSEPDTDGIYDFVKEFVTEYNNLIDEINLKIGTKPAKDIMPLTAEERDSMSESEIKLWEEKLNSSLFYQDQQLTDFVNSARNILGQVLGVEDGKPNSLASLGIVTGSWEERGKLHIEGDEDDTLYAGKPNKLKAAIEKDPQAVADLLNGLGEKLYKEHDDTLRASNELKSAMNFYNDKVMSDKVKTFDKQIITLEERMYRMEQMHYAKFAAMEKMLNSLNSQSSWLSQQFGG